MSSLTPPEPPDIMGSGDVAPRTASDNWSTIIAILSLLVSLATLYWAELRGPEIKVAVGRDLFVHGKPYVGVMLTIYNAGGQAGSVVHGTLTWDRHPMTLVMTTTEPASWTYETEREERPMRFSFFSPITVESKASHSAVIWFTPEDPASGPPADALFTEGIHRLALRLFDDVTAEPIVIRAFSVTITQEQQQFIHDSPTAQLPLAVLFDRSPVLATRQ